MKSKLPHPYRRHFKTKASREKEQAARQKHKKALTEDLVWETTSMVDPGWDDCYTNITPVNVNDHLEWGN